MDVMTTHNSEYAVARDRVRAALEEAKGRLSADEINSLCLDIIRDNQKSREYGMVCAVETKHGAQVMEGGSSTILPMAFSLWQHVKRNFSPFQRLRCRWHFLTGRSGRKISDGK